MAPVVNIELRRGNILDYQADVCVSTIHRSRNLKMFQLSHDFLKACGSQIQAELFAQGNFGQDMKIGEIAKTSAGNLESRFQSLLFLCLYKWQEGNDTILLQGILECLKLTYDLGYRTIAFPALGMGGQQYPAHLVATCLTQAVAIHNSRYAQTHQSSGHSLQTVYIVLLDQQSDAIKSFLQICLDGTVDVPQSFDSSQGRGRGQRMRHTRYRPTSRPLQSQLGTDIQGQTSDNIGSQGQTSANIGSQGPTSANIGGKGQASGNGGGQAQTSSDISSMVAGLLGAVSYFKDIGPLKFNARLVPGPGPYSIGAQVNISFDLSFLKNFIPTQLTQLLGGKKSK